jgi:TonB family protein
MITGPIDKRLRESTEGEEARAGKLLRELPEPGPLSEPARRRALWLLRTSGRNGRALHFTALQWVVFSILVVSTAAASAKRIWFPSVFHRHGSFVEPSTDRVAPEPVAVDEPSTGAKVVIEEPASPRARPAAPTRARASTPAKSEPVRPRLLSDPQKDAIPRVLPRLVYDEKTYSAVLDVCVSSEGRVSNVSVVRGQDPALDRDIVEAVRRWNYAPALGDGQPVPMCFPLVYRIQVERD